jgi:CHASE1-domain containing sensor protein
LYQNVTSVEALTLAFNFLLNLLNGETDQPGINKRNGPDLPNASQSIKKDILRRCFFNYLCNAKCLATLVFFTGLSLSLFLAEFSRRKVQSEASLMFSQAVDDVSAAVQVRLQSSVNLLQQTKGLFDAAPGLSRKEFKRYVDTIEIARLYPGLQGLGYAPRIDKKDLERTIAQLRDEGYPQFAITPPFERAEYYPVLYLEPFDWRNQRAFGFDMMTEPTRRKAMEAACQTETPQMTDKVRLLQETDADLQPGFLIHVPVFDQTELEHNRTNPCAALRGFVYSPFRATDFFSAALDSIRHRLAGISIEVYSGVTPAEEKRLYVRKATGEGVLPDWLYFIRFLALPVAGHSWFVKIYTSPSFANQLDYKTPRYVFATGAFLSLLLSGLLFLVRQRGQADSKREASDNLSLTPNLNVLEAKSEKASKPPEKEKRLTNSDRPLLKGKRILVIDDEEDARLLIHMIFGNTGAIVVTAHSGLEGYDRLEKEEFDAIICDIGMPEEDGYSFARTIRSQEAATGRPKRFLTALTAYASELDRKKCFDAGYDIFLSKPVNPPELIATIEGAPLRD